MNHIGHFFEASGSASSYFYDLFTTLMGKHKKKSVVANFMLHPAKFQVHTKGPLIQNLDQVRAWKIAILLQYLDQVRTRKTAILIQYLDQVSARKIAILIQYQGSH